MDTELQKSLPDWDRRASWKSPDAFDMRTKRLVRLFALFAFILGYLGTLLTQTITFVGSTFHAHTAQQGVVLAWSRIDFLLAMGLTVLADRHGRRQILLTALGLAGIFTALSGVTPSLWSFTLMQIVAHGVIGAATVTTGVMMVEIVPKNSRAYTAGLLAVAGGLGGGLGAIGLSIADTSSNGWRWLYIGGIICSLIIIPSWRSLPESKRFVKRNHSPSLHGHWRRLLLLALGGFLFTIFVTPATDLRNDWLRTERGFSGHDLTLFSFVAYIPAGGGILLGGWAADRFGRRRILCTSMLIATTAMVHSYNTSGWQLWLCSAIAGAAIGCTVPTLAVYGPELFPTSLRATASGLIGVARRGGAVIGLVFAPKLVSDTSALDQSFLWLSVGPLLLMILVIACYPETAHKSLEELNIEDLKGQTQ